MAVNKVPVLKRCRSLGLEPSYLGYDKKSRRNSARANKKVSEYGLQLREKQKAKFIYGVLEKPFHNYYEKADRMKGMTGQNLMTMLESRLDNVVFRMGFARTRRGARQLVNHGHILVNGKKVDIPSAIMTPGCEISIKEKSRNMASINEALEANLSPKAFVTVDKDNKKGTFVRLPERNELNAEINEQLIVEFYNR